MKLVAFLQLYNELSAGNLVRCLNNCRLWADEIFIYDDSSDDGSQKVYEEYTPKDHIIVGNSREFNREQFHKQQLLALTLQSKPDWIGWIDGDTILCDWIVKNCRVFLDQYAKNGFDAVRVHNMNLWRSESFYRIDSDFDGLWHVVFWRNNGRLRYNPIPQLHQAQYPLGMPNIASLGYMQPLIHYGFASEIAIARKYLTYKSYGQTGVLLDRLITEIPGTFQVRKAPANIYPEQNLPIGHDSATPPSQITFDKYKPFNTWEEFVKSQEVPW